MNAERLLAHYERIADAPDAIDRLRRFILNLAVRGKLVPQDPRDEPASELLKRIAKEKARLVKAGEARKLEVDPVALGDEPFAVPPAWTWTRLGSIGDWGSGSTPPRGASGLYGGNVSWLKSGELNDNRALAGSEETVTEAAVSKGSFRLNKPGDVLIAMYGATIGKVAILAESAVTNQAVCGCTPFAGVFNQFLFLFLLSQREQFHSASEGGAQPNISKVKIVWTPFPLPPLAEQHRIIGKVDELMGLCDRLAAVRAEREATRDRLATACLARLNAPDPETFYDDARFVLDALPALTTRPDQIKRLRQTILNLAVRGKLVPQDPNDEPGMNFDLSLPDDLDRPFDIPRTWHWARLHMLGKLKGGGTPSKAREDFWNGNIPWVSPKDMKIDYIAEAQMCISEAAIVGSAVNLIERGSVLFVVRGMILAHSFPVAISHAPVTINQDMKALVLKKPEMGEYVLRALKGTKPEMLKRVQRSSHGTCRLEGSDYRDFLIPIPPLAEQHRIVAKVDALMVLCDRLEASLAATADTRRRLLDALLAEALAPVDGREMEAVE